MKVLVTGGTGYIGSHTCIELLQAGHSCVILDNLNNSEQRVATDIAEISGKEVTFLKGDILDEALLTQIFSAHKIDAVMHFAGKKAVGESVELPLDYYHNNVAGTVTLLRAMKSAGCKTIVFSSSSTVYGDPEHIPATEDLPLRVTNPYGRTKLMIEDILRDLAASDPEWRIALLRYFNPIGAHESGRIGENPKGIPNNLMPFITKVAMGRLEKLSVFGNDYNTPDGTGVRDYIHVVDLAIGHVDALTYLAGQAGILTVNLGTGKGYSVLDIVQAFEKASGIHIPYAITPRRAGDIAINYADASLAKTLLGWTAKRDLETMCRDSWHFAQKHM